MRSRTDGNGQPYARNSGRATRRRVRRWCGREPSRRGSSASSPAAPDFDTGRPTTSSPIRIRVVRRRDAAQRDEAVEDLPVPRSGCFIIREHEVVGQPDGVQAGLFRRRGPPRAWCPSDCRSCQACTSRAGFPSTSRQVYLAPRTAEHRSADMVSTAAPSSWPCRSCSSASFAWSSRNGVTWIRSGKRAASARNSSPSRRVRLATERITRSSHNAAYGNVGMSLIWIPPHTTTPPLAVA